MVTAVTRGIIVKVISDRGPTTRTNEGSGNGLNAGSARTIVVAIFKGGLRRKIRV